jgi:hypothetical protein
MMNENRVLLNQGSRHRAKKILRRGKLIRPSESIGKGQ